jgi:hypothetical protein
LPQLVFVWHPNSHRLFAGLQKWLAGHDVAVHIVGRFWHALLSQYWPAAHDRPHMPQLLKSVRVLLHEDPQSVSPAAHCRVRPPAEPPPMLPPPLPPPTPLVPPPAAEPPPVALGTVH